MSQAIAASVMRPVQRFVIGWGYLPIQLIAAGLFLLLPIWQEGMLVGGDWIFPYTQQQLQAFYRIANSNWGVGEIPTGTHIPHHNLYLLELLSGIFVYAGTSGVFFQKTLLSMIIIGICFSSYFVFLKICKNSFGALLGSSAYLFSPIFFDYLSMGWIWVLLFMALLPIIVLLTQRYFLSYDSSALIAIGLLTSLAFVQAQAVFWVPLVIIMCATSQWVYARNSIRAILTQTSVALLVVASITFIVHMCWILPSLFATESLSGVSKISNYDFLRFNIPQISAMIRGWGSVFNAQFELAYNPPLTVFSFFPPFILVCLLLRKQTTNQFAVFATLLALLPFVMYSFRFLISDLPFAGVVRDFNRFIVLSNFGFSLAVSLFFAAIKDRGTRVLGAICLLISVHPFHDGSLFAWDASLSKNQPTRFLTVPQDEIEGVLQKYAGDKNLLFPTGGHVGSFKNVRFSAAHAETPDFDAQFSPYASGIYASDKSSPLVANFAAEYIAATLTGGERLVSLSRIYGIENIFIRKDLFSSYNRDFNSRDMSVPGCVATKYSSSEWSISKICSIRNPYPVIYVPQRIIVSENSDMTDMLGVADLASPNMVAVVGCPSGLVLHDKEICSIAESVNMQGKGPSTVFTRHEPTKYSVDVTDIKTNYLLVLNQTFNSGWVIRDAATGDVLEYKRKLVNHLVNGWLITPRKGVNHQAFVIEFGPQKLYSRLRNISIIAIAVLTGLMILLHYAKRPLLDRP